MMIMISTSYQRVFPLQFMARVRIKVESTSRSQAVCILDCGPQNQAIPAHLVPEAILSSPYLSFYLNYLLGNKCLADWETTNQVMSYQVKIKSWFFFFFFVCKFHSTVENQQSQATHICVAFRISETEMLSALC